MNADNLLKRVLILVICLFGAYVYVYPPTKDCCKEIIVSENEPATMSKQLVQNMIDNYKNNQLVSIGNDNVKNPVSNDARAVWFDIKDLKNFIKTIENKVPKGSKNLGIRFYYAAYPSDSLFGKNEYLSLAKLNKDPITKLYGNKHTLIMIPTTQIDGKNLDFNPSPNANKNEGQLMAKTTGIDEVMAKNHGILYPPGDAIELGY